MEKSEYTFCAVSQLFNNDNFSKLKLVIFQTMKWQKLVTDEDG